MINLGVPFTDIPVKLDIYNTSESEALAMAFGINISGGEATVYTQDDGFLGTLGVYTTLLVPYDTFVKLAIKERGDLEHHKYATGLWRHLKKLLNPSQTK